jgi:hypothetical protein
LKVASGKSSATACSLPKKPLIYERQFLIPGVTFPVFVVPHHLLHVELTPSTSGAAELLVVFSQLVPEIRMRDPDQGFAPLPESFALQGDDSIFGCHMIHVVAGGGDRLPGLEAGDYPRLSPLGRRGR